MKLTCDRGALVESLSLVNTVIAARTPKPVLRCIKLTATTDGSGLLLAATDLEAAVQITCSRVEVQESGEALIPAEKFVQIARESLDSTLSLEIDQDVAHVRAADSYFKVFGSAVQDFPPCPALDGEPDFQLRAGELVKLVTQTLFATARESSRYAINGVLLERNGKKLSMIATDGRRLALAKGQCKSTGRGGGASRCSAIVPTKALNVALRVFQDPEQTVNIRMVDNQILFVSDHAFVGSRLVEGRFPPYQDVIPRDADRKATLSTETLASAVRRAALLANEESRGVRMAFGAEGLKITSQAPEMGEAEIDVELCEYSGDPVEVGFNPQFITDALRVADAETITLELKGPNKPGTLRAGTKFLCVVMPVNLQ